MRGKDFEERLSQARTRPDLMCALSRLGFHLKRVGHGSRYNCTEYRISTEKGHSGDYSALVFCENSDGTWRVIDNKQRYGRLSYDAIGCLTEFFGHSFDEAVYALAGVGVCVPKKEEAISHSPTKATTSQTEFVLPKKTEGKYTNLFAYLCSRGITNELISSLVKADLIYQSDIETKNGKLMPTIVFPIYDEKGKPVGADSCGTYNLEGFKFKHVYSGSDPSFGWRFANNVTQVTENTPIFFCESPIDAMSLCLLTNYEGIYVSMAGCKDVTFENMCKTYGGKPIICTDDDDAGHKFRRRHPDVLSLVPDKAKDWNDILKANNKIDSTKTIHKKRGK